MSVDLGVRLEEPIVVETLRTETERALKEILNISEIPPIRVHEYTHSFDITGRPVSFGILDPKNFQCFEDHFFAFIYEDGDEYHRVDLLFIEVSKTPHPKSREDWEIWGQMSLSMMGRSYIQVALMAAISIALARLGQTTIEDCAWMTPYGEPTVDQLFSAIANPIQYPNISEAADAFHKRWVDT